MVESNALVYNNFLCNTNLKITNNNSNNFKIALYTCNNLI